MTVDTVSCQELVELVTDYLEGRLSWSDRQRVETHLRGCDGCTTYVEQMRDTVRLAGAVGEGDLTPQVRDELLAVFRDWKARP